MRLQCRNHHALFQLMVITIATAGLSTTATILPSAAPMARIVAGGEFDYAVHQEKSASTLDDEITECKGFALAVLNKS